MTTKGIPPDKFGSAVLRGIKQVVDTELIQLEGELIKASPVGVAALLKGGWNFLPFDGTTAAVTQSQEYFLPVELGRKPGTGISAEGQTSTALWATRKLGLSPTDSKAFAYNLSQKYKRVGNPAKGFAGLANKGDAARQSNLNDIQPVQGGLINQAFKEIDKELGRLNIR